MTQQLSELNARSIFIGPKNVAYLNRTLETSGSRVLRKPQLAEWYDLYMCYYQLDVELVENVDIWVNFMNENYMREWRGHNTFFHEKVPYLPYSPAAGADTSRISHSSPTGRFPKYNLESAVEDYLDEDGNFIIRNCHQEISMFTPVRNHQWHDGPVSKWRARQMQNGSKLIDRDYRGSLVYWDLLSRPHTKRDMSLFLTENRDKPIPKFSAM